MTRREKPHPDVAGVLVGNADDARAATGAAIAIFEGGAIASVSTLGGAPGSRGVTILEPEMLDRKIDAVVLPGGSLQEGAPANAKCACPARGEVARPSASSGR